MFNYLILPRVRLNAFVTFENWFDVDQEQGLMRGFWWEIKKSKIERRKSDELVLEDGASVGPC